MNWPAAIGKWVTLGGVLAFAAGMLTFGWTTHWWQWLIWAVVCLGGSLLAGNLLQTVFRPTERFCKLFDRVAASDYRGLMGVHGFGEPWIEMSEAFDRMRLAFFTRESRLKDTSQRMESVLGSMMEGVLAVDGEEKVILFNREAKRMLGVSQLDVIGRSLRELVRIPELNQVVSRAIANHETVHSEFTTTRSPRRVISMRARPLPDDYVDGLTIVLEDVTELRHLENLRRDFVANVSHELKTPLTAIKAYAETLRLGAVNDPENCISFIEQIELQSDRLHQLILDLIRLAQVESGEKTFEIEDVDVAQIVESCAELLKDEAEQREVGIKQELPSNQTVLAAADREGVRTIIENLVSNAIRYTPAEGLVTIRCERVRNWIVIEVSDTGIGIAPEHIERIFERFYRVDKARSRDVGGTGLGLSIVKHIVQSFGGTIELESEMGKGSNFRVRLPAAK